MLLPTVKRSSCMAWARTVGTAGKNIRHHTSSCCRLFVEVISIGILSLARLYNVVRSSNHQFFLPVTTSTVRIVPRNVMISSGGGGGGGVFTTGTGTWTAATVTGRGRAVRTGAGSSLLFEPSPPLRAVLVFSLPLPNSSHN